MLILVRVTSCRIGPVGWLNRLLPPAWDIHARRVICCSRMFYYHILLFVQFGCTLGACWLFNVMEVCGQQSSIVFGQSEKSVVSTDYGDTGFFRFAKYCSPCRMLSMACRHSSLSCFCVLLYSTIAVLLSIVMFFQVH